MHVQTYPANCRRRRTVGRVAKQSWRSLAVPRASWRCCKSFTNEKRLKKKSKKKFPISERQGRKEMKKKRKKVPKVDSRGRSEFLSPEKNRKAFTKHISRPEIACIHDIPQFFFHACRIWACCIIVLDLRVYLFFSRKKTMKSKNICLGFPSS